MDPTQKKLTDGLDDFLADDLEPEVGLDEHGLEDLLGQDVDFDDLDDRSFL
jgi:hypothetical protein